MITKNEIDFLIIHCSDTPDSNHLNASDIHNMHLGFGWDGIGYHKVIKRNGKIENGRPEFWIGAHTYGLNDKSLGVCLIGRNNFTKKQFNSLRNILIGWKKIYTNAKILGHCEAIKTKKTCPNFDVSAFLKESNLY
jgi:N-acetylmuramoyl-L-alanine amidase